jgi:hypothetical protein
MILNRFVSVYITMTYWVLFYYIPNTVINVASNEMLHKNIGEKRKGDHIQMSNVDRAHSLIIRRTC